MMHAPKTIKVTPETSVGSLLDEAAAAPVVLETNGTRYRLVREPDDPWAGYDPERVREGLRRFAGTLSPEEGERIKRLIYRGREEGTRPPGRP